MGGASPDSPPVAGTACRDWRSWPSIPARPSSVSSTLIRAHTLPTGSMANRRGRKGAERVIKCDGIVVSFNGNQRDLPDLAKIIGVESADGLPLRGVHCDMSVIASRDRWPPDPGTEPIRGECLAATYEHHFPDDDDPVPPASIADEYEQHNWRDCWLAATLWKRLCGKIPA